MTDSDKKFAEIKNQILAHLYQHYDSILEVSEVWNLIKSFNEVKLKEELMTFIVWYDLTIHGDYNKEEIIDLVNEYLKQREYGDK